VSPHGTSSSKLGKGVVRMFCGSDNNDGVRAAEVDASCCADGVGG
jgi:hypothetical protein